MEKNKGLICSTEDCGRPAFSKGMCRRCYGKFYNGINPKEGKSYGKYRKTKRVMANGYVVWHDPTSPHANAHGHVYEHRHVMGEYLGRRLLKEENVHHKNGDRSDNRLDNLELWSKAQPCGQRVEDKVAYARHILELYADLVDGKLFTG